MLVGFLIRSPEDWEDWKRSIKHVQGKSIIHVADRNSTNVGCAAGEVRMEAIDEVETISDDDDETILRS